MPYVICAAYQGKPRHNYLTKHRSWTANVKEAEIFWEEKDAQAHWEAHFSYDAKPGALNHIKVFEMTPEETESIGMISKYVAAKRKICLT